MTLCPSLSTPVSLAPKYEERQKYCKSVECKIGEQFRELYKDFVSLTERKSVDELMVNSRSLGINSFTKGLT